MSLRRGPLLQLLPRLATIVVAGWLLGVAHRRQWMAPAFEQIAVVTVPLLCLVASEACGASMFIAAFVAGICVQVGFKQAGEHSIEFTEEWGQFVNLFVFFLFGMLVHVGVHGSLWASVMYAAISLTVVRMLPVAVSLVGTGLDRPTVLFMGWFGPRGLASIVLGLVYLEQEAHLPGEPYIRSAVAATVLISIFAHGLSAMPGIGMYAKRIGDAEGRTPA